ncbi:response regulator transcription factor [Flexithrix dorotheae]|uniref:response regulator transcription factor n=1 Tax=Flexithrix dorotheae TaxID=70993 RepID=UPI0003694692|nr:response regulator [Flexithrix dorotheae]
MEKQTILIIDDHVSIRKLLEFVLAKDYNVITKQNGLEAIKWIFNKNIPDLIIADIDMPELDGYSFTQQLKAGVFYSDIPIIILSGNDSSDDKIKLLKVGVEDYMVKPFNPKELLIRVDNLLKRSKASKV